MHKLFELVNYVRDECSKKSIELDVMTVDDVAGDKSLVFRLTKCDKKILVKYHLRDIVCSDEDDYTLFDDMDRNIKNII